jgi:hypothetical protein
MSGFGLPTKYAVFLSGGFNRRNQRAGRPGRAVFGWQVISVLVPTSFALRGNKRTA